MEQYYLVLLAFLGVIAVIDLFVGVSNDAVNFLNSALGCRISSFRTTLWVASIGVLAGATFSSGMMEIALPSSALHLLRADDRVFRCHGSGRHPA